MLALTILIFGLLVVLLIAAIVFVYLGMTSVFAWVVPIIPGLIAVGTLILAGIEVLMFFGGPDDRKTAKRDMALFIPTILISAALSYGLAFFLWR